MIGIARILTIALLAALAPSVWADEENLQKPMTIEFRRAGNAIETQWISASGTITTSTPDQLREFLAREGTEGGKIVFDSPGGDLLAGLEIGRIVRDHQLASFVGRSISDPDMHGVDALRDGVCLSSCAYAFLGGVRRDRHIPWADRSSDSLLGFHRFYDARSDLGIVSKELARIVRNVSLTEGQIVSGLIAAYLSDMGVDAKLLAYATEAGPDQIRFLTDQEAIALAVFTRDGFGPWFLEPYKAGLVAATREHDPLTLATQITAYCRSSDSKHVLMITSDWSSREPSPLPSSSPANETSEFGARVFFEGFEARVPPELVSRGEDRRLSFIRIQISKDIVERLLTAERFGLSLDAGGASGVHSGGGDLSEMDRKMIALAFRNCV